LTNYYIKDNLQNNGGRKKTSYVVKLRKKDEKLEILNMEMKILLLFITEAEKNGKCK